MVMKNKCEYSKKEIQLLEHFGVLDLVEADTASPPVIYAICMKKAFLANEQNKATESLRRCVSALSKCHPYRMTPEWDAMIEL